MKKSTIFTLILAFLPAITLSAAEPMHIEYEQAKKAFPVHAVYWPGLNEIIDEELKEVRQKPRQPRQEQQSGRTTPLCDYIRKREGAAGGRHLSCYATFLPAQSRHRTLWVDLIRPRDPYIPGQVVKRPSW